MPRPIGRTVWVIPEGCIPSQSPGPTSAMSNHEMACLLNAGDEDAHVRVTIYFVNREPSGPYHVFVPARRTLHLRFNDLAKPEPIPRDTSYSSVIESDTPIVVQHTRLDARQAEETPSSTIAYSQ
jgi:hypothetical protein